MASTGLAAWKKHFSGKGDLQVVVNKPTNLKPMGKYPSIAVQPGEIVTLKALKNDKEYLSYAEGKGANPIAWLPVVYKSKNYLCTIANMAKPSATGRIDLKLQTSKLISGAKTETLDIFGQKDIECAVFSNTNDIVRLSLSYINSNTLLNRNLNFKKSLVNYFESGEYDRIKWYGDVSEGEVSEFKYIGELSIALLLLKNKSSVISGTNPFKGKKVKRVIYPLSESFRGADSIAELADGTKIPISSKAGKGSAASFWANMFPSIIEYPKYRPKGSIFGRLYESAKDVGVTNEKALATGAKKIIYEYGIRNILRLDKKIIQNTYKVFEEFVKYDKLGDYSPEVRTVYKTLEKKMKEVGDATALKNLDASTTVFFSRQITNEINADKKALNIAKEIVGNKQYYQMTLDLGTLRKGTLEFRGTASGAGDIEFQQAKSAYGDINAKQGTLNFYIKPTA